MMRYIITSLCVWAVLALNAQNESFELILPNYMPVQNGDTILVEGTQSTLDAHVYLKNTADSEKVVKVKQTNLDVVAGSFSTFCWAGQCFPPGVFLSTNTANVAPQETNTTFLGDYMHNGHSGISYIMYTFFDIDNENDSIAVVVKYDASAYVGLQTIASESFKAYPNPCNDVLHIETAGFELEELQVLDLSGKLIMLREGNRTLDVSELRAGLYLLKLVSNTGESRQQIIHKQ